MKKCFIVALLIFYINLKPAAEDVNKEGSIWVSVENNAQTSVSLKITPEEFASQSVR